MKNLKKNELIEIVKQNIQEKEELEFLLESLKEAQEKIEEEHKFLETVLNALSDPVMIINNDYSVQIMNEAVKKQLHDKKFIDASSPKCYEISHNRTTPCDVIDNICPLKDVIESKKPMTVLHNHKRKDGSDHFVELAVSPLLDENGNCSGIIESARDVTPHIILTKELEAKSRKLQYEASHDYLTGLPNRALFMDRLDQGIKDLQRNKSSIALFFMDLDHFKDVNDTLGHHMGDETLREVCRQFKSCTRVNDTLSRLGGDEFTVILRDVANEKDASLIAQKFMDIFEKPLLINGHLLRLSVSIGISIANYSSMYTYDTAFQDKLLQEADTAMYVAKSKGRNNFVFAS